MGFSAVAWTANNDVTDPTELTPVADPDFTIYENAFYMPSPMDRFMGLSGFGANLVRLIASSPTLRAVAQHESGNIQHTANLQANKMQQFLKMNAIQLEDAEPVRALSTDNGAANNRKSALGFFTDGNISPITGQQIFTVKASASVQEVAFGWATGQVDIEDNLPRGLWALVGAKIISATAIAARFVFPGSGFRPTTLCVNDEDIETDPAFRLGMLGIWGQFDARTPPKLQVFSSGTGNSQQILLDLVRITSS